MKELAATPDNLYVLDDLDTKLSAGNRPLSQTEFNVIVIYFYCVSFVSNGSMSCLPRSWTMYPTPDDGRCRIQTLPVPKNKLCLVFSFCPQAMCYRFTLRLTGSFCVVHPPAENVAYVNEVRAKEFQANLGVLPGGRCQFFWLARQM